MRINAMATNNIPADPHNFAAFSKANTANIKLKHRWSAVKRAEAERVLAVMQTVFEAERFYLNFRKRFIAVKAQRPRVNDAVKINFLYKIASENGYEIVGTPQGIIVRIR